MIVHHPSVLAGLDPAIHSTSPLVSNGRMDVRVEPAHDAIVRLNHFLNFLTRHAQTRGDASDTVRVFAPGAVR
jgi:hypothetical protein